MGLRKKRDIILHDKNNLNVIIHKIDTIIKDKYHTNKKDDIHIAFDGKHYYDMFKGEPKIENEAFINRLKLKITAEAGVITKQFKKIHSKQMLLQLGISKPL